MSGMIDGIAKDLKSISEKLKEKMGSADKRKLLLTWLPYVFAGHLCDKTAWLWRISLGRDAFTKLTAFMEELERLFASPMPSFYPKDILAGVCGGAALRLAVYLKTKNAKKFRNGVEYGSAR